MSGCARKSTESRDWNTRLYPNSQQPCPQEPEGGGDPHARPGMWASVTHTHTGLFLSLTGKEVLSPAPEGVMPRDMPGRDKHRRALPLAVPAVGKCRRKGRGGRGLPSNEHRVSVLPGEGSACKWMAVPRSCTPRVGSVTVHMFHLGESKRVSKACAFRS